jgi:hypothetical protein
MAEVQRQRDGGVASTKGIREAELETLLSSLDSVGDDRPGGDFFARTMPGLRREAELTGQISRIVKVYRLREVIAQVGFTRFEAAVSDVNGELALDVSVRRSPSTSNGCRPSRTAVKASSSEAWSKPRIVSTGTFDRPSTSASCVQTILCARSTSRTLCRKSATSTARPAMDACSWLRVPASSATISWSGRWWCRPSIRTARLSSRMREDVGRTTRGGVGRNAPRARDGVAERPIGSGDHANGARTRCAVP